MKKKIKVVILMGGKSSEREISLLSGKEILANIDKKKYTVKLLNISDKRNNWIDKLKKIKPNVVFIALHGTYGEDGSVQGVLEHLGIPYTGSGILASAIGMDKRLFKKLMRYENIPVPKDTLKAPCFIKPSDQGSSVGASVVRTLDEFKKAVKLAKKYSENIIVEEYLRGKDITCGVIGNKNPIALPLIEIRANKGSFFNYKSKYEKEGAEEIVPAPISKSLTRKIQKLSLKVFEVVGCRGFARIDFILKKNGSPVVLEINTIPGMTKMSLVPKAAGAAGLSYTKLIDKIINYAIEKR